MFLFEERCQFIAVILYVEHEVKHELAKGQFHITSIFEQIFQFRWVDFCKMSKPVMLGQSKIHLLWLHIPHQIR